MEKKYILVIDEGTTSVRSVIFDRQMQIVGEARRNTTTFYPEKHAVEQDAGEIYERTVETMQEVVRTTGINAWEIAAIGITTQRATWTFWNRETGEPIRKSIVWADTRACYNKAKLLADPEFVAKFPDADDQLFYTEQHHPIILKYIQEHEEGLTEELGKETTIAGTVDTWLLYKFTGGKVHATSLSEASMTMFYTFRRNDWDYELVRWSGLNNSAMAEIRPDMYHYGDLIPDVLGVQIPIVCMIADQHAALFSQGCLNPGQGKGTMGTGFFFNVNIGKEPVFIRGYKTAFCWEIGDDRPYIFEGTLPIAGAALEWMKNKLRLIDNFSEMDASAQSVEDSGGIYFIPALVALCNAPFYDSSMEGCFIGITADNDRRHFLRAIVEGVAFLSTHVLLDTLQYTGSLSELRISGGVARSDLICQIMANVSGVNIVRGKDSEATAKGAAEISGLYLEWLKWDEVEDYYHVDRVFTPNGDAEKDKGHYAWWKKALGRVAHWNDPLELNP